MSGSNRLQNQVAEMITFEGELGPILNNLARSAEHYADAYRILRDAGQMSDAHRLELQSRSMEIGGSSIENVSDAPSTPTSKDAYPVTDALSNAASEINRAVMGYSILRSVALRHRDSSLAGERNTGDMAEQYTKDYVEILHQIYRILHNVVLWELEVEGEHCMCTCPSCGLGICMCSQGPRRTLSDIWQEAGPISDDRAVLVHQPRPGSAAAGVGLKSGDRVLEADGKPLETHFVLQGIISGHTSGDEIALRVERQSGEIELVPIEVP